MEIRQMAEQAKALGAANAAVIPVAQITFDPVFRSYCEANTCGNYGKSWRCPPDEGPIDELIAKAKSFEWAVVYQTIGTLEDSFDFEGMLEAGKHHNALARSLNTAWADLPFEARMHLGAGGCRMCEVCAKRTGEPCRHPQDSMSSLETYGINVSALASTCGMNYINGKDTVTYFGAYFVR